MSTDHYVMSPLPPDDIVPSAIGLGTSPFVWGHADDPGGWSYEGANIRLALKSIEWLAATFGSDRVPLGTQTVMSLSSWGPAVADAGDLFQGALPEVFAAALSGVAATAQELADAPMDRTLCPPDARTINAARAAWFVDRYAPRGEALSAMIETAVEGELGAVAVIVAWCRRSRDVDHLMKPLGLALGEVDRAPDELLEVFIDRDAWLTPGDLDLRARFSAPLLRVYDEYSAARRVKWMLDGGTRYASGVGVDGDVYRAHLRYQNARSALVAALRV